MVDVFNLEGRDLTMRNPQDAICAITTAALCGPVILTTPQTTTMDSDTFHLARSLLCSLSWQVPPIYRHQQPSGLPQASWDSYLAAM